MKNVTCHIVVAGKNKILIAFDPTTLPYGEISTGIACYSQNGKVPFSYPTGALHRALIPTFLVALGSNVKWHNDQCHLSEASSFLVAQNLLWDR